MQQRAVPRPPTMLPTLLPVLQREAVQREAPRRRAS